MPAKGQTGGTHSPKTRKKISDAVRKAYDEGRLINWKTGRSDIPSPMKGKHHSEETKKKISESKMGQGVGNKYREGKAPWNKGKPHPVHNAEWRQKVSEANSRENHWNWKGGISTEDALLRHGTHHKEWSLAVLKKDRWVCQQCGYNGRLLTAHHVVPWKDDKTLRYEVSNGITLCRACHCGLHKPRTGTGKPPMAQSP